METRDFAGDLKKSDSDPKRYTTKNSKIVSSSTSASTNLRFLFRQPVLENTELEISMMKSTNCYGKSTIGKCRFSILEVQTTEELVPDT